MEGKNYEHIQTPLEELKEAILILIKKYSNINKDSLVFNKEKC